VLAPMLNLIEISSQVRETETRGRTFGLWP